MNPFSFTLFRGALSVAFLWMSIPSQADDTKKPEPAPALEKTKMEVAPAVEKPKPEVKAPVAKSNGTEYTVKTETLTTKVKTAGTVESTRETPVEMDLKRWKSLALFFCS